MLYYIIHIIMTEKQKYYPLLSLAEHVLEGQRVYRYDGEEDRVVLVNGKIIDRSDYGVARLYWEKDGFSVLGCNKILYPENIEYCRWTGDPIPDCEMGELSQDYWERADHRLHRARKPLSICDLNGDVLELEDWATETDLVQLVKNRWPEDDRFKGQFRLLLQDPDGEDESLDISWLDYDKWGKVLNGNMDLVVHLWQLDEEEAAEEDRKQERAKQPLVIHAVAGEKYTLENWASRSFYADDLVDLVLKLHQKYPELDKWHLDLQMILPGEVELKEVSVLDQQTLQRILEADTPLEMQLVQIPL